MLWSTPRQYQTRSKLRMCSRSSIKRRLIKFADIQIGNEQRNASRERNGLNTLSRLMVDKITTVPKNKLRHRIGHLLKTMRP